MAENADQQFNITMEDVRQHAPRVYISIQEYYTRIDHLIDVLEDDQHVRQVIHSNTGYFGILPSKNIKYEEILLDNEEFRVAVTFNLCITKALKTPLTWETFIFMKTVFERAFMATSHESLSVDSMMLKTFKVDPAILPTSYLTKTMHIDEFNQAVEIIATEMQDLDSYENFDNYDEYFDYMQKEVAKITKICNDKGYWGTHTLDRFTCACISQQMRIPAVDLLYNIEEAKTHMNMETENIKQMQEQILLKVFGEDGDEREGPPDV